jgi:hypothetical protein
MHALAQNCKPRDSIFDKARRDTVLDLTDLGKELVLLAWAIEEADPALIPQGDQELARPRPRGTLAALHHDLCGHGTCDPGTQQGMAQGGALRPDGESGDRLTA